MKRVGYIFEKICSIENLQTALTEAVRGKKKTKWITFVLENRNYFVQKLHDILITGNFKPSKNIIKTIIEPVNGKERRLEIPAFFPDRVVHWAVCIVLNPIFMKGMYRYNVGSVPRRGCSAGKKYIRKVLRKDTKIRAVMKLDIRKYFQSVSHLKLKELLRAKIKDKKALELIDRIIDAGTEGLPIGYYSSQWFSNFYLEKLDSYIKEKLSVRYYVRNVDDMLFLDTNKRKLHKVLQSVMEFLAVNGFVVKIKDNWQVWKLGSRPIDFLGIMIYPNKIYIRKRNFYRFMRKVCKVKKRGYCTVRAARGIMSGLGALKQLPHGKHYYQTYIKPIITKGKLRQIISTADRRNLLLQGA